MRETLFSRISSKNLLFCEITIVTFQVWPSPRILLFHDLITDNEAQVIMSLAQPGLNRATVHNKITGEKGDFSEKNITTPLQNKIPNNFFQEVRVFWGTNPRCIIQCYIVE